MSPRWTLAFVGGIVRHASNAYCRTRAGCFYPAFCGRLNFHSDARGTLRACLPPAAAACFGISPSLHFALVRAAVPRAYRGVCGTVRAFCLRLRYT